MLQDVRSLDAALHNASHASTQTMNATSEFSEPLLRLTSMLRDPATLARCALVLAAPPSSFVLLDDPTTMMGAMYGDYGFHLPVNTETGVADGRSPVRLQALF
jgi:hypothetical protein